MNAEERRHVEAAMAKISEDKKGVEADPAAAIQASLDEAMVQARQRLRGVLLASAIVALAALFVYMKACS